VAALLTSCGDDPPVDEGTPAPAAFESPVDHQLYCGWRENLHECAGSGYPPAPFAMPTNDLDRSTQGVSEHYDLLEALLLYHITYHAFYNNPWYYDNYITPAWSAYPGTYYAWGGHPVVRVTNVTYYTVNARSFDNRYRARERSTESQATYRTKTGKTYNGKTVPTKKFAGTNAKPGRSTSAPKTGTKNSRPTAKTGSRTGSKATPPRNRPAPKATPPRAPRPAAPAAPRPAPPRPRGTR
jgi:hypothetical protein